ncbi:hypothetical protein ARMGADRAFT_1067306 [Armillaria gallica]|uniref:Uncharacterized protein n=1 Tax=Armillaria gallica TaxID=47427 RepID=A0A2H3D1U9_ARMGA|nr:hypothetical protein ARMGADRAFT_1067306 [Armillaria gallica]
MGCSYGSALGSELGMEMEPNVEVMEEAQSDFGTAMWPTLRMTQGLRLLTLFYVSWIILNGLRVSMGGSLGDITEKWQKNLQHKILISTQMLEVDTATNSLSGISINLVSKDH